MLYGCIKMGQFDEKWRCRRQWRSEQSDKVKQDNAANKQSCIKTALLVGQRCGDPASFSKTSTGQWALPESKPREQSNEEVKQTHAAARSHWDDVATAFGTMLCPRRHRSLDAWLFLAMDSAPSVDGLVGVILQTDTDTPSKHSRWSVEKALDIIGEADRG